MYLLCVRIECVIITVKVVNKFFVVDNIKKIIMRETIIQKCNRLFLNVEMNIGKNVSLIKK